MDELRRDLSELRVCMLVYNHLEVDPRVWKEARSLVRHGAAVDVYMFGLPHHPTVQEVEEGFTVHRFAKFEAGARLIHRVTKASLALLRAMRGRHYDVFHCHDGATLPWGFVLTRIRRSPFIYDAHEFFPDYLPSSRRSPGVLGALRSFGLHGLGEWALIRRADRVITVNRSLARLLRKRYSLATEPTVLRNTVSYWDPRSAERHDLRLSIGVSQEVPLLAFSGHLSEARGIERCFDLVASLPRVHFVALGGAAGDYRERLLAKAKELGIEQRVHFPGRLPYADLLSALATCDAALYLLPKEGLSTSYFYSLPNKVFEYIMARLPMVVSDLPELEALVEGHGLGAAVDPAHLSTAKAAIERILDDADYRKQLDVNLQLAASELSWEKEEGALLELYRQVVRPRNER